MHYYAVNFVFNVSFRRGSKRKKNIQKKKGHFERSSLFCFRPFPETTFLERPRCRGAVLSSKKKEVLFRPVNGVLRGRSDQPCASWGRVDAGPACIETGIGRWSRQRTPGGQQRKERPSQETAAEEKASTLGRASGKLALQLDTQPVCIQRVADSHSATIASYVLTSLSN